jgi:hypothetical protein
LKMNALDDPGMMRLLVEASCAGVHVDLLVRGICCLRPGVPGLSENIRVTSIVGRFLEHSRIYYFQNGGSEEIYVGSADLMPRNIDRRVEVLFPVASPRLIRTLREDILSRYLADDATARHMRADGSYTPKPGSGKLNSQADLLTHYARRANAASHTFGSCSAVASLQRAEMPRATAIASVNTACHVEPSASAIQDGPSTHEALRETADRMVAEIGRLRERLGTSKPAAMRSAN